MRFPNWAKYALVGWLATVMVVALGAMPVPMSSLHAQEGITVFGNIPADLRLGYLIDRNDRYNSNARYYLRVAGNKVPKDVIELSFTYPSDFTEDGGEIMMDKIQLRRGKYRGDEEIPVQSIRKTVSYDMAIGQERDTIEIIPENPIPQDSDFVIVLQQVRNPRHYGYHYFNLQLFLQGDVQRQYAGTWPLEIGTGNT